MKGYWSQEADLSQLQFRIGARVQIRLKNGKTIDADCPVPPGFAGDPSQADATETKFLREISAVWSADKALHIRRQITQLEQLPVRDWLDSLIR